MPLKYITRVQPACFGFHYHSLSLMNPFSFHTIQDPDFSASEPENHSPPYYAPSSQASAAVIAVRPLTLSRTSSDPTVSVHMQASQQVSISMGSQLPPSVPPYPRQHAPSSCPSLATVQHTSLPTPTVTSPIQGHTSLPWQRSGSGPYPCVYSQ